jgi:hypothetical protein
MTRPLRASGQRHTGMDSISIVARPTSEKWSATASWLSPGSIFRSQIIVSA